MNVLYSPAQVRGADDLAVRLQADLVDPIAHERMIAVTPEGWTSVHRFLNDFPLNLKDNWHLVQRWLNSFGAES